MPWTYTICQLYLNKTGEKMTARILWISKSRILIVWNQLLGAPVEVSHNWYFPEYHLGNEIKDTKWIKSYAKLLRLQVGLGLAVTSSSGGGLW